jgi:hypothetical protein
VEKQPPDTRAQTSDETSNFRDMTNLPAVYRLERGRATELFFI